MDGNNHGYTNAVTVTNGGSLVVRNATVSAFASLIVDGAESSVNVVGELRVYAEDSTTVEAITISNGGSLTVGGIICDYYFKAA